MKYWMILSLGLFYFQSANAVTLSEQNEALFSNLKKTHNLNDEQMGKIRKIFSDANFMGQGNPKVTDHPASKQECIEKLKKEKIDYNNASFEKICGAKYMAPLYKAETEKAENAKACIDQFEFPNIPCDYPVVWVRANEAAQICQVMGKQLCDAHEWEGACAGSLEDPDYDYSLAKSMTETAAIKKMRYARNQAIAANKTWAYGKSFKKGICGQNSYKHDGCNGGDWQRCGSNTYPSGYFPQCKSPLEVYDQHGNAAEHMNLPVTAEQSAHHPSGKYGHTEMKGSWFIWDKFQAHKDHCRWRAPYWHGSRVMDKKSHHNYHLGFRCCKRL